MDLFINLQLIIKEIKVEFIKFVICLFVGIGLLIVTPDLKDSPTIDYQFCCCLVAFLIDLELGMADKVHLDSARKFRKQFKNKT